jgi:hypothetical protein
MTTDQELHAIADEVSAVSPALAVRLRAIAARIRRQEAWLDEMVDSARIAERVAVEHLRPRR